MRIRPILSVNFETSLISQIHIFLVKMVYGKYLVWNFSLNIVIRCTMKTLYQPNHNAVVINNKKNKL
jgi:hypothetical protein